MNRPATGILTGALLIAPGLLLSSDVLIDVLHGPAGVLQQQLSLGALLFRSGLVVSGLYFMLLGFLPLGQPASEACKPPDASVSSAPALLFLLVFAAIVLRIYHLDSGIWLDEMLTYINYMPLPIGEIFTTFDDANNHLLYTLLASLSFNIFGEATWSLRLPAVLFGVGSVPALYYFARQVSSEREAIFSAALFVFSYHHIWFSQNGRGYTALLFLVLLSSTFLLLALRHNRVSVWLLYAVTAALGVFTHLTMGFVIVTHFIIYLRHVFSGRAGAGLNGWTGLLAGFAVAGLLSFLSYALVLPQMFGGGLASGAQGTVAEWTNPVWMVLEIVRGVQIGFAGGIVALAASLVFIVGLADYLRKAPMVIVLLFMPTTLGFLVMISIGYTLFPRFFFFAMGFAVIVVIRGAMLIGNFFAKQLKLPGTESGWPGAALCTGLLAVSMLSVPFVYGPKQDYQGALDLVEQERMASDSVVTVGVADFPFRKFYRTDWTRIDTLQELDAVRSKAGRTWLVYTLPLHTEAAYPELFSSIKNDFTVVREFFGTLNGGTVVVSLAE